MRYLGVSDISSEWGSFQLDCPFPLSPISWGCHLPPWHGESKCFPMQCLLEKPAGDLGGVCRMDCVGIEPGLTGHKALCSMCGDQQNPWWSFSPSPQASVVQELLKVVTVTFMWTPQPRLTTAPILSRRSGWLVWTVSPSAWGKADP